MRRRRKVASALVALLSAAAVSGATASTVAGSLRLRSGEAIPAGLEVRLVQLDTGHVVSVRSDAGGRFTVPVEPGLYGFDVGRTGYSIVDGAHVVSVAPGQVLSTALVLATGAAASTPTGPRIVHEAVGCLAAEESPEIDAVIEPAATIAQPRVYFRFAREKQFHSVPMVPEVGRFVACLPPAILRASPVTYYVAASEDGVESRTTDIEAEVVGHAASCPAGRRMAVPCPCAPPMAAFLPNGPEIGIAFGILGAGILFDPTPASGSR